MLGVEYKHKISNMNLISFNVLEMCNFCSQQPKNGPRRRGHSSYTSKTLFFSSKLGVNNSNKIILVHQMCIYVSLPIKNWVSNVCC